MSTRISDLPESTYSDSAPVQRYTAAAAAQPPAQQMSVPMPHNAPPQQQQQQRLPHRDIPSNTDQYTYDEQVKPNYIPPPPPQRKRRNKDYITDEEEAEAAQRDIAKEKNRRKKWKDYTLDDLFAELYLPIYLAMMFFVFQLNVFETALYKYTPTDYLRDWLFNGDGTPSFAGSVAKSLLFGAVFYFSVKAQDAVIAVF